MSKIRSLVVAVFAVAATVFAVAAPASADFVVQVTKYDSNGSGGTIEPYLLRQGIVTIQGFGKANTWDQRPIWHDVHQTVTCSYQDVSDGRAGCFNDRGEMFVTAEMHTTKFERFQVKISIPGFQLATQEVEYGMATVQLFPQGLASGIAAYVYKGELRTDFWVCNPYDFQFYFHYKSWVEAESPNSAGFVLTGNEGSQSLGPNNCMNLPEARTFVGWMGEALERGGDIVPHLRLDARTFTPWAYGEARNSLKDWFAAGGILPGSVGKAAPNQTSGQTAMPKFPGMTPNAGESIWKRR